MRTSSYTHAGFVWFLRLLFGVVYAIIFWFFVKPGIPAQVPLNMYGKRISRALSHPLVIAAGGFGIGVFALLTNTILCGIKWLIVRNRAPWLLPWCAAIAYGLTAGLGYWLLYVEPRYTEQALTIILFTAKPLYRSSLILIGVSIVWFVVIGSRWLFHKKLKVSATKVGLILFLFLFPFIFGCDSILAGIGKLVCKWAPDTDHCFQRSAVQRGNPDDCAKIQGKKFKDMGSNPPRDKCYLMIAENKGDWSICKYIKGGMMSYTQDECIKGVSKKLLTDAITKDNPSLCKKLATFPAGYQSDYVMCKKQLCSLAKLQTIDTKMKELLEKAKNGDSNAKKELQKMKQDKQIRYEQMSEADKATYFKSQRDAMFADIEDDDVKSAIAKEYTNWKSTTNPTKIDDMIEKLADIVTKQKMIKNLDEQANETLDAIKQQIVDFVQKKKDDAIDEIIGAGKNAAEERIKKNGGDNLKYSLDKLKRAAEKYDKASKEYKSIMEKYDKVKSVYDEIMSTYKRIDQISDMVAQGKIDEGKAKVLKGAILLDKGLEYTTAYIPIFGSTVSKVSKATFNVVIEFSKKRAERSKALEKCFEDPENCDTDKISAY